MKSLVIDGKEFVKGSILARELHYTSDYIGQLCRAGKVEARLVGRSWYVEKDSVLHHKANRYQNTISTTLDHDTTTPVYTFYSHSSNQNKRVVYSNDATDLLPVISPKKVAYEPVIAEVPVHLADATEVKVKEISDSYVMRAPKREVVHFKGDLVVQSLEQPYDFSDPSPTKIIPTKLVASPEIRMVHPSERKTDKLQQVKVHINDKGGQRSRIARRTQKETGTIAIPHQVAEETSSAMAASLITGSFVIASFLAVLLLGIETHVSSIDTSIVNSFDLRLEKFESLGALLYALK